MRLDSIQASLQELLQPSERRGFFQRLWGITQEPAELQVSALSTLIAELAPSGPAAKSLRGPGLVPFFDAACRELESNVRVVRELGEARRHPPFAYVTWLWRVSLVLDGVRRAGLLASQPAQRASLLRLPLEPLVSPLRTGPRLRGLAFAPLLEVASRETHQLGRRRRLLEAARRLLLETAASVPQAPGVVQAHSVAIAEQIGQLNQWQAEGIDADVDVAHQLRAAIRARDSATTTKLLSVLERISRGAARAPTWSGRVARVQQLLAQGSSAERLPSLPELTRSTFGATAAAAIQRGSARALSESDARPNAEGDLVRAGFSVDGAFELGRSVSPVRTLEVQRRMAEVDYPTQSMVLSPARRVSDLPNSLIGDPRLILRDFATRALLSRRYRAERTRRRAVTSRFTEARYYLLDGSASMAGRRGRMRDAILIAELSAMIRHLEQGTATARPVVYYRYFSKGSEPVVRSASVEDACAAIEAVLVRKSRGETDIEGALLTSFAELQQEREKDDTLKRAQLVLVSDGGASVDAQRIWQARERLGEVPIQVSVIALGNENPALRELAARERARGEEVFYHFFSDESLHRMARGVRLAPGATGSSSWVTVAVKKPAESEPQSPVRVQLDVAEEAWRELDELVAELGALREPPDLDGMEQAAQLGAAYEELGMSLSDVGLEAERARYEATRRDQRALTSRFERWFPESMPQPAPGAAPCTDELLEVVEVSLLSVLELVSYLNGSPLQRCVDAIELLEQLLCEAGVTPWLYCQALPFALPGARAAIAELRARVL